MRTGIDKTGNNEIDSLFYDWKVKGSVITFSFNDENDETKGTYSPLTSTMQNHVRDIFYNILDPMLGVSFQEVPDADANNERGNIQLVLDSDNDLESQGIADLEEGLIRLRNTPNDILDFEKGFGSFGYSTMVHEILHTLGLKHPGNYNGQEGLGDAPFLPKSIDNTLNSIMSYNVVGSNPATPMPYDIRALQYLYGKGDQFSGDTKYIFQDTFRYQVEDIQSNGMMTIIPPRTPVDGILKQTIFDSAGINIVDFSNVSADSQGYHIELKEGGILTKKSALNASTYTPVDNSTDTPGLSEQTTTFGTRIAYDTHINDAIGSTSNDHIFGNFLNNYLYGNDGDDFIDAYDGNDYVSGGNGFDILFGDSGNDIVSGGEGNDLLFGEHDYRFRQWINPNAGNDTLYAGNGDDYVDGGQGDDLLYGGNGNDFMNGRSENDQMFGGSGNDDIHGEDGNDLIDGHDGNDRVWAGNGQDTVEGGSGNDSLRGWNGEDWLIAENGDDFLYGEDGDDSLHGGSDNDFLDGGQGNDKLWGDDGNDSLHGNGGNDFLNGGLGDDRLFGDDGDDSLHGHGQNDHLDGGQGNDFLFGDDGNDGMHGNGGNDFLDGGLGDDFLFGDDGDDSLHGNEQNDHLDGGQGDDKLWGNDGNDSLHGNGGNDFLNGGLGDDFLFGSDGQNVLEGGNGQDTLSGGSDSDTFILQAGAGLDLIQNFQLGKDFLGLVDLAFEDIEIILDPDLTDWAVVNVIETGERLAILDGIEVDDFMNYQVSPVSDIPSLVEDVLLIQLSSVVPGTSDEDDLNGTSNANYIQGLAGDDTIAGGLEDDEIEGGEGDDILRGDLDQRDSQNNIDGGNDTIRGGLGNDRIGGKSGDDALYGDEGDDQIWGDAGDDLIQGGLGNDTLTGDDNSGSQGSDTFILSNGGGTDFITDFEVGIDFIGLTSDLNPEQLLLATAGNSTEIYLDDNVLAILENVDLNELTFSDLFTEV